MTFSFIAKYCPFTLKRKGNVSVQQFIMIKFVRDPAVLMGAE
jgi:hypothetical protein